MSFVGVPECRGQECDCVVADSVEFKSQLTVWSDFNDLKNHALPGA